MIKTLVNDRVVGHKFEAVEYARFLGTWKTSPQPQLDRFDRADRIGPPGLAPAYFSFGDPRH